MKLSVVIPVYNEKNTIKEILKRVKAARLEKEIIIVDDASTDGTREYLMSLRGSLSRAKSKFGNLLKIYYHTKNQGKGSAVKTGLKYAVGKALVIQDADLEYDPKDYEKLLQPILERKAKVVYGSRLKTLPLHFFGKNKTPLPFHYLANYFLSVLTNLIYNTNLTDMETGYKMFSREVYKKIKIEEKGFAVEPELTAKIAKLGYKICEVPIKTKPRTYAQGKKITFWDAILAIWILIKYK